MIVMVVVLGACMLRATIIASQDGCDKRCRSRYAHRLTAHRAQRMPATLRTARMPARLRKEHHHRDTEHKHDKECSHHCRAILTLLCSLKVAPLKHRIYSAKTRHHTLGVVTRTEVWQHIVLLYAVAKHIGKHTLQTIARMETYLTHIAHKQNTEAVIQLLVAYAPLLEQRLRETHHIAWTYVIHRNDSHLRKTARLQSIAYRVERSHRLARENTIGVRDKASGIHTLHILHIAHTVCLSLNANERETKRNNEYTL